MGSSKKQTVGYRIFLGMHLGICKAAEAILQIKVLEKELFSGVITSNTTINIDKEDLFGGDIREGGISGDIDILFGGTTQTKNTYLEGQLGEDIPNFKGQVSAVLKKCYLGLNPYLKAWTWRVKRVHKKNDGSAQWYDSKAGIPSGTAVSYGLWYEEFDQAAVDTAVWNNSGGYSLTDDGTNTYVRINNSASPLIFKKTLNIGPYRKFRARWRIVSAPLDSTNGFTITFTDSSRSFIYRVVPVGTVNAAQSWSVVPPEGSDISILYSSGSSFFSGGVLNTWRTFDVQYNPPTNVGFSLVGVGGGANQNYVPTTVGGTLFIEISVDPGVVLDIDWIRIDPVTTQIVNEDMNPAHIIRECLTDPGFGLGYPDSDIDDTSFMTAADTLYTEGMGMSLIWDKQTATEDFIKEILRHISAVLYIGQESGKFTLKLIRNDYTVGSLLVLDPSNIVSIDDPRQAAISDPINKVTVVYWNMVTGADAAVSVDDPGLAADMGYINPTTVKYPGFTHSGIAIKAAERDFLALSSPLLSTTVTANRVASNLQIGGVFVLDYPKYDINSKVMRIFDIAYGDGRNNQVKITCTEDVFNLPPNPVVVKDDDGWVAPSTVPVQSQIRLAIEAPYFEAIQQQGQSEIDSSLSAKPEIGYLLVAADRPTNAINAEIWVDPGSGYEDGGILDYCPYAILADSTVTKTQTVFNISEWNNTSDIRIGSYCILNDELMRVDVVNTSTDELTVGRGALDSVPSQDHTTGDMILFLDDYSASDETEYVQSDNINVKLLTRTASEVLSLGEVTATNLVFAARAIRPYPPGNVQINSNLFPDEIVNGDVVFTWAHRDRVQQTGGTIVDYEDGNVGPEAGQTYTLDLYDETDTLVRSETGLTGTTYTWTNATELTDTGLGHLTGKITYELYSVRDGWESLNKQTHTTYRKGYGFNYGSFYGE